MPLAAGVTVTGLRSLLTATDSSALRDVAGHVEVWTGLDADCEVSGVGRGASEGIEIRVGARGTQLTYPFELNELYEVASELEDVYDFDTACEWLAGEIAVVEGFDVRVSINYESTEVPPEAGRRDLSGGDVVQHVGQYPYVRAMRASATFEQWVSTRFNRRFAGLRVEYAGPAGYVDVAHGSLGELRILGRRCGRCGSPVVPVVYGMPTEEMWLAAERSEIILGGCSLSLEGDVTRSCVCGALATRSSVDVTALAE